MEPRFSRETQQRFNSVTSDVADDGDGYIESLLKRLNGRIDSIIPHSTIPNSKALESDSQVRERLLLRNDCDTCNFTCLVPLCGRSFTSLQLLAWHMSYAHQDLVKNDTGYFMCYLCGFKMYTIKGRNIHLISKHRVYARQHHQQCLEQRSSVIAPDAPAAKRLCTRSITMQCSEDDLLLYDVYLSMT